jgi:hypothetical protein
MVAKLELAMTSHRDKLEGKVVQVLQRQTPTKKQLENRHFELVEAVTKTAQINTSSSKQ